jgi:hypothetical protein
MNVYALQPRFAALFDGLKVAHGTGKGQWIKRPLRPDDWVKHLNGEGVGIGVAPLRPDNTVMFAAIDLDEPDFEAAREMQKYIPGVTWIERSRSGNAHIWVFFKSPCPAWVAMGILREATLAAGKKGVEVFPKNPDFARVRLGNYINLPFHGACRPVIGYRDAGAGGAGRDYPDGLPLPDFLDLAEGNLNDPVDWERRAAFMQLSPPSERKTSAQFGSQKNLHICAEHIISGAAGTIPHGHQNATLFMLAKCLTNWEQVDHDETLDMMRSTAADLFDPVPPDAEIRRILTNVERAQYTSVGCDDVLVQPFAHPNCSIANP